MLPFVYGFTWSTGNVVFLGIFFAIVIIIAATLLLSVRRAMRDIAKGTVDAIRWHSDFHDLPSAARTCRHQYTGEFRRRMCDNEFDCRACETHAKLLAAHPAEAPGPLVCRVEGFDVPLDRFYHRGHTWVRPELDGTVTVGLDELAVRLVGNVRSPLLPAPGSKLTANGTAWQYSDAASTIRILSPIDGEVVEQGTREKGWFLRIRPTTKDLRHLLKGREVALWFNGEFQRLQQLFVDPKVGMTMADGGAPVQDFERAYPNQNWDLIHGEMFLEA